jgi:hypothetical protein
VLRWAGLAALIGSVLFLVVFVAVGVLIGAEPTELDRVVTQFPDIRVARTVEDGLYLVVLMLWVAFVLALRRALQVASPAAALIAGALPHIMYLRLFELSEASGVTAADRATIELTWQTVLGLVDMLLFTGLFVATAGIVALGGACCARPRSAGPGAGRAWRSAPLASWRPAS